MGNSNEKETVLFIGRTTLCQSLLEKSSAESGVELYHTASAVVGLRMSTEHRPEIIVVELPLIDAVWIEFHESLAVLSPASKLIVVVDDTSSSYTELLESQGAFIETLNYEAGAVFMLSALRIDIQPLVKALHDSSSDTRRAVVGNIRNTLDNSIELACADVSVCSPEPPPSASSVCYPEPSFASSEAVVPVSKYDELLEAYKKLENHTKLVSEQVLLADNYATLGVQMADIVHHLNNCLNVVVGYAELLNLDYKDQAFAKNAAEVILDRASAASRAVHGVTSIADQQPSRSFELVNFADVLQQTISWRQHNPAKNYIEIAVDVEKAPKYVQCDDLQIKLMLIHILMNAEQAVETKMARLRTGSLEDDPAAKINLSNYKARIEVKAELIEDNRLRVSISDNGCGAPAEIVGNKEHLGSMYNAFFTNDRGKGHMGLGLTICSSIARSHNGAIYSELNEQGGVRTVFELPVNNQQVTETPASEHVVSSANAKRILVIEDDPLGAKLFRQFLHRCGFIVDFAGDGLEALDKVRATHYDAIVCDYNLPKLNGREFYLAAVKDLPYLADRVVFVTGFLLDAEIRDFFHKSGCTYLIKPFSQFEVLQAVDRCLEAVE